MKKTCLDEIIERFSIFPLEFTLDFQHVNLAAGNHNPDQDLVPGSLALQADTHLELKQLKCTTNHHQLGQQTGNQDEQ